MAESMKAWRVKQKDDVYATVVFAETRGKARSLALATDCCEYAGFCNIEVRREPNLDKCYVEGKKEMDWYNPQDRIALVKECGFRCEPFDSEECERCPAVKYCDYYDDYIDSIAEMDV